ncbi:Cation/H(+) antiporter 15 [Stylosanthes scabra]|uniref:Cation/H(+) antiporter 15 n=1 Tax=Stylosanthes scabra TaxID=79078 RepID=A0ABU6USU8_9FABA|nr:Cation/H(+) antiporter 15 [Stylosanthes scabra]
MASAGAPPPPPAAAFNESDRSMICYTPTMTTTNGVWQSNPLRYALPLFVVQLTLVVLATRLFYFILRPFHQPRLIAEILGGLLLGPSVLGQIDGFAIRVFPLRSVLVLETMAYIGLIYFMFLIGLEMDIDIIKRTGKKAISIAIAGMVFPFLVGFALAHVFQIHHTIKEVRTTHISYIIYLGVVLSVTAFPVLVRMLADLKLVNTELGKLAISTSLINDTCAWVLLAVGIAFSQRKAHSYSSLCVFLSSLVFVAVCIFVVRPMVSWMIRRTPEGQPFSETQICIVLTGVIISGFITDALGTHSVFGAFVYGLVIPNGPLAASIIDKLEDFVSGLLLPLFFAISGLKTNLTLIKGAARWGFVILVIPLTFFGKVLGTLFVSLLFQVPVREGVILGLLMNTKGFIEIIVLNVGWDQKVLGEEVFSIMILVTIVMTAIISPTVALIHKPRKRHISYKNRTMQSTAVDAELRILVCIHVPRNVPTIINLLEETNPTIKSPITANVLHLVELTGRASAMLVVHADSIRDRKSGRPLNKTHAQTEHIMSAFRNFEENVACVSVQPLTVVSPYPTMHEDICSIAEEQRVSFIIIPFHKQQTVAGEMEETIPAYRLVNHNLLQEAPCSVGILVDRGLNGSTRLAAKPTYHQVTVLFFGGPDDREALSYGWRMSRHPRVRLTVMHFVNRKHNEEEDNGGENYSNENKCLDEEIMYEVEMIAEHDDSVEYLERVVGNGEETIGAIRAMKSVNDLFIVGRGQGTTSPLTEGLTDWSECPELGAIGDLLASSDFETSASVLVVNQYVEERPDGEEVIITEKPWLATDDDFYQTLMARRMSRRHRFESSPPAMY